MKRKQTGYTARVKQRGDDEYTVGQRARGEWGLVIQCVVGRRRQWWQHWRDWVAGGTGFFNGFDGRRVVSLGQYVRGVSR